MKKLVVLLALVWALVWALGMFSALAGAEEAAPKAPPPPSFSLAPQEFDGPKRLHFKATLRLWKHAQVTAKALQACGDTTGADQALEGFQARNGNTLRMLRNIISKYGGLSPEIKALVDREVTAGTKSLLREVDCLSLTDQVLKNGRDLYKAPELAEDYALVRSQP